MTGAAGHSENSRNLTLLWGSGSEITLEEKNLQGYKQKLLSFGKVEHKSAEVLSMDPESQGTCKTKKMPAYLILVGLLFFCRLPLSQCQACRPNLLENVNFPGEDITSLYSPDAEHCQKLCTQYPKCFFFTFYRADWTRDN
ncbi:hypothetical protein INR49_023710, partial [Caranx melampygus]